MSEARIDTEVSGGVMHVCMHRPAKKNALTRAMYTAMGDALEQAASDAAVRVVVLSGAGDTFTAGNDLADFAASRGNVDEVARFLTLLVGFEKLVIAAVRGAAVGVGTTMLLHCDLVYVAESARLRTPFVDLGLVPEAGSSLLLPRAFGHVRAAQLLLAGETIDGATATAWGLANAVVPDDAVLETALGKAADLAARAPEAVRLTKQLMRAALAEPVRGAMHDEAGIFKERLTSKEAMEAMMAFMQKRKPDFSKLG